MKKLALVTLATLLLACSTKAPMKDAAVTPAPQSKADVEPHETRAPSATEIFLGQVDELRKSIREKSLESWVELDNDIPLCRINVELDTEFMMYRGDMDLWVKNRSTDPWNELHFHLYPNFPAIAGDLKNLRVGKVEVNSEAAQFSERGPRLVVTLPSPLEPGAAAHANIRFEGLIKRVDSAPADTLSDMWRQLSLLMGGNIEDYGVFAYAAGVLSMALWHPVLAAYDNGWDWPEDSTVGDFSYFVVADHAVTVKVHPDFTLIATGVEVERSEESRTFFAGGAREFMLMASKKLFVLTRLAGLKDNVTVNSYAFASDTGTQRQALQAAVDSVNVFEKLFGPYPYRELDVVETELAVGIGGVEFPGLITIARMLYLDTMRLTLPDSAFLADSRYMRESVEFVVAHEVAHQWWSAVVGSHSRKYPFVDEALANYSAILYFEQLHDKSAMNRQILLQLKLPYQLHRFLGGEDMVVDSPTSHFDAMLEYSGIIYGKGALFLHAVRDLLATEPFQKALSSYYSKYRFLIASPDQLLAEFEAVYANQEKLDALARRWLKEKHGDEDIQLLDPAVIVPLFIEELDLEKMGLAEDSWVVDMFKEEGFWELIKLGANVAEEKEDYFEGVRLDKIVDWGSKLGRKLFFDLISF